MSVLTCENMEVYLGKPETGFHLGPLNLELKRGLITGLVGRSGAGKTTLIRTLNHEWDPAAGQVLYDGKRFEEAEAETRRMVRACLGEISLPLKRTAGEHASLIAAFEPWFDWDFFREKMAEFGLPADQPVREYSEGMQKVFDVLLEMCRRPEVLLLDEPTSGVDPVAKRRLLRLLQEFMEDENHTILFSTQITEDLDRIADRVILLDAGKILLDEETEDLKRRFSVLDGRMPSIEEIMEYVYEQKKRMREERQ